MSESRAATVAWVIGSPVEHSLSPVIHNAAFDQAVLDWRFFAVSVPLGRAGDAIAAMRSLQLGGMSVTMPHKEAVAQLVDELTPRAAQLESVNCVFWRDGKLVGDNTDGAGFVDSLRIDHSVEVSGQTVAILGAGGAARAVVAALAQAGVAQISIVNRSEANAVRASRLAPGLASVADLDAVGSSAVVINATPVGLGRDRSLPAAVEYLNGDQVVVDLIYHPPETPFLAAARQRGARTINGLGMLVHQAGHAFTAWTGAPAPLEAMSAAVVASLQSEH